LGGWVLFVFPLLFVAASAASGAGAATDPRCNVQGEEGATSSCVAHLSSEAVLLQSHAKQTRTAIQAEEVVAAAEGSSSEGPSSQRRHLSLCHPEIVSQTCRMLNGAEEGSSPPLASVSKAVIADLFSASDSDMTSAWTALGMGADQLTVECEELCASVLRYTREVGAVLPPSSDVACYSIMGNITCDVDVDPYALAQKLATAVADEHPDEGPSFVMDESAGAGEGEAGLVQVAYSVAEGGGVSISRKGVAQGSGASALGQKFSADRDRFCPYSVWETVEKIAGLFRMSPSDKQKLDASAQVGLLQGSASTPYAASADEQRTVAARHVQAKAWLSSVVPTMNARKTGELRQKWFGGAGSWNSEQVRDRVLRTMNFIERELYQGFNYIYPADGAPMSACTGGSIAYVWRYQGSGSKGYEETKGPVCSSPSEATSTRCGVDPQGKYFVYLCRAWFEFFESSQISIIVHEAAHHAGPRDVTYSKTKMQQGNQPDQLNNAGNYQYFAEEAAASSWALPPRTRPQEQTPTATQPTTCEDTERHHCQSYRNAGYCSTSDSVKRTCRKTCGFCTASAAPQPTTCEDTERHHCQTYRSAGYCSTSDSVKRTCRRTCNLCR
jgi:hypothetical protein